MRRLVMSATLALSLAGGIGCGGGAEIPSAPSSENQTQSAGAGVPVEIQDAIDAEAARNSGSGYLEITDLETGALVSRTSLSPSDDGDYSVDVRSAQDLQYSPVANQLFRVALALDTDGPAGMVPRGYTAAGNPLYYVGDTVCYDASVNSRQGLLGSIFQRLGAFDIEFRHTMGSGSQLIPECVAGQNPLTIQDVDYLTRTPSVGPYSFSVDGKTFSASDMHMKLCDLPGMVYGTDKIDVRVYWVVDGAQFGLPCQQCEVRCVIFDQTIGIYDPPGE